MTGWRVEREPNGIRIYFNDKSRYFEFFLDEKDCAILAKKIWHAQREYWKMKK